MSRDNPDWNHVMRRALENFNGIHERLRSNEVHMNGPVIRRPDISKYFRGGNIISAGGDHDIQVGQGSAIDRESDVATILLEPRRFGKQKMNLVSSRRNRIRAVKNAAPPIGEKHGIFCALNRVTRNGESASSRAKIIALPLSTSAVRVGSRSIAQHRA